MNKLLALKLKLYKLPVRMKFIFNIVQQYQKKLTCNFILNFTDTDEKQDDIILPPPLIPMKIVDDFEDVDKELEEEIENMNLDDIESTVK